MLIIDVQKTPPRWCCACGSPRGWIVIRCAIFLVFFFFIFASFCFAQVVINEVFPNPSGNENQDEWVELYNGGSDQDVNGWVLYDASDHELIIDGLKTNTSSTIISSDSWLVIYRRGVSFSLNNSGSETVKIYNALISTSSAELIDSMSYSGSSEEKSWGRIPNGTGGWLSNLTKTPGSANQSPTPTPSPTPTSTPKPTSTSTSTPTSNSNSSTASTPIPTFSPSPILISESLGEEKSLKTEEATFTGEVLGATESGKAEEEERSEEKKKDDNENRLFILPLAIVASGLLFMLAGSFPFVRSFIKKIKRNIGS